MTLSPSDLSRLEELAKAATPGKRTATPTAHDPEGCDYLRFEDGADLLKTDSGMYPPQMPDARFIAACDRETILVLVDEVHGWRTAAGIERTAGPARCIIIEPPETTPSPILCRAEPAPPVEGRVSFEIERILDAREVDAVPGRRRHTLSGHAAEMLSLLAGSLEEERIGLRPYRIRISIEPEGR